MNFRLPVDWQNALQQYHPQLSYQDLLLKVASIYEQEKVYPPASQLFDAFRLCPFNEVKVVIIGQDPYHGENQAHGLAFSVNQGIRQPPSLKNIFKELCSDIPGFAMPVSGNLDGWAKQGVLLLNAVLTVREATPGSHKNLGWQNFTDAIIKLINDQKEHVVFLLWGNFAISKTPLIDGKKHLVLTAPHPSPLARGGFFGCKHFSQTNKYLKENYLGEIDWSLT